MPLLAFIQPYAIISALKNLGALAMSEFINPHNVVRIALYLLNLDISAIEEKYQLDMSPWVSALQDALTRYRNYYQMPLDERPYGWSNIDLSEYHLKALLEHTKAFIYLLTPEAKSELQHYVQGLDSPPHFLYAV